MPYSEEDKQAALARLEATGGDINRVCDETGISRRTLKRWYADHQTARLDDLQATVTALHTQLAHNALHLAAAMDTLIDDAPLNQVATALSAVIDRYLKLDEHLSQHTQDKEQVIRVEYQYPDGTLHHTPLWARDDSQASGTLQSGSVWQTLRQDGDGQTGAAPTGIERGRGLVVGSDVSDGESGLAGLEGGFESHEWRDD